MTLRARSGRASLGGAGLAIAGELGGRQAPEFEPPAPAHRARRGTNGPGLAWHGWVRPGEARRGKDGWTVSGAVRLRTTHAPGLAMSGRARLGVVRRGDVGLRRGRDGGRLAGTEVRALGVHATPPGLARLCGAWRGDVGRGMAGGWSSPGFDSLAPTHEARRGPGKARQGGAMHGDAWLCTAGVRVSGTHPGSSSGRPRMAGLAQVRRGMAGHGMAWHGEARKAGGWRPSQFKSATPTQRGMACPGAVGRGSAWQGSARQAGVSWRLRGSSPRHPTLGARLDQARRGRAVLGKEPTPTTRGIDVSD